MNGPMAQDALLSFALPSSSALRPSKSRRFTSLPRAAPSVVPRLLTASTISGSGLFQLESGWMPTSEPHPTADRTGALVKISASGPIPTSRYCDHAPCAIKTCLTRAACSEPGTMPARLSPNTVASEARIASARAASPRACSSITRSSRLATKVTPLALTGCRSQGASSQGRVLSRVGSQLLASMGSNSATRGACRSRNALRIAATGWSSSSSWLVVGARCERSKNAPPSKVTTTGPTSGNQTRPRSVARALSWGRMSLRFSAMADPARRVGEMFAARRPSRNSWKLGGTCDGALRLQRLVDERQVLNQLFEASLAFALIAQPQQRRRVQRREDEGCVRTLEKAAAHGRDAKGRAKQNARRGGAQADDDLRSQGLDFAFKPLLASLDLALGRCLVQAAFAARSPFEVLDGVGEVDLGAVDPGGLERAVEQSPRRSNEGQALLVFF